MKRKITIGLISIMLIGVVFAGINLLSSTIELEDTKVVALKSIGTGIDNIKMINPDCNDEICRFLLYKKGAINKDFHVSVKECIAYTILEEGIRGECSEWYYFTDNEIMIIANRERDSILDMIAEVKISRDAKSNTKRFDDRDISIISDTISIIK